MRLSDLCIRRPVFASMLILSLVVLGLSSYRDLGLDAFPRIEFPTVTITTTLGCAGRRSAREIPEIADKRIKRQIETVSGVGSLTFVGDRKREIQVAGDAD